MAMYTDHSKFVYQNYDKIQDGINDGSINAWDVILCRDTKEMLLVKDDLTIAPIKSKVYRFLDVQSAEEYLNKATDTYEGQIVSIVFNGVYVAYIVNRNNKGEFYVTPMSVYSGEVDYNTLGHRPIENLEGTIDTPIIVDRLETGIYKIDGQYKLTEQAETTYFSVNSNFFLVEHPEGVTDQTYIKRISAHNIYDYSLDKAGNVTTSIVPTTEWLKEQGYVTERYVDAKIAALNFITKEEIEDYVENVVLKTIDAVVDERISNEFDTRFRAATEKEILDMFTQIFTF